MAIVQVLGQLHIGWFIKIQIQPPPLQLGCTRDPPEK